MSIPVLEMGKESEVNWDEVKEALRVISSTEERLRISGMESSSVAVAFLISTMNIHTVAMQGDMFQAFICILERMRSLWPTVIEAIKNQIGEALKLSDSDHERSNLSEEDIESLKKILINIDMFSMTDSALTAEEIVDILTTQNDITGKLQDWVSDTKRAVLMRVLIVMAQQLVFFEMNGNVAAAKAAFVDQQQLLWPIALENSKSIIKAEVEETKDSTN